MNLSRALFVVYDFPPEGARGTKRTIKFIRYLPANGWSAVVLTVAASPSKCSEDPSLFAELPPDLPVYRSRTLETLFHGSKKQTAPSASTTSSTPSRPSRPSLLRRMVTWLYHAVGRFTRVPDARILWIPFAFFTGLKAIKHHQCKVIYSSGPSHTNHLLGALLSRVTGLPLFMDFRDAWVANPAVTEESAWNGWLNRSLERFCIHTAKGVICTTDGIQDDFNKRYPGTQEKYVTITNGFDRSDFSPETLAAPLAQQKRSDQFTLVHAGTLGEERSPKEFLEALGQVGREHPELTKTIRVIFVGKNTPFNDGKTIEEYVEEFGVSSMVRVAGYVSRKESLDLMVEANGLLLIIGRVPKEGAFVYGISGKLYDYAAAGRPVLTVSEPGSTASVAQKLNLGPVVDPDQLPQIKEAILQLCRAHQSGKVPYNPDLQLLKSFEFSSLAARLAQAFSSKAKR